MPNIFGTKLMKGEFLSTKFPGYIEKSDGKTFRKPFVWVNKEGKMRNHSSRHILTLCRFCKKEILAREENYKKSRNSYCDWDCRKNGMKTPDGKKSLKKRPTGDAHVYIKVAGHPQSNRAGYVPEHRVIVEQQIGRYLEKNEIVHHINCVKNDNCPENLVVCKDSQEHFSAHGSLNKCVAKLIAMGVLIFDRATMSYQVCANDEKYRIEA